MFYNIIPAKADGTPVTRDLLTVDMDWELVKHHAIQTLVQYPEATKVIVTDGAGKALWEYPEHLDG
jgi:hypothetical protein